MSSRRKPSEVYSDKHTLVEVTVHRRPKQKPESKKSWSESLSDSESVVFKKPSQSKSRSPRVVKRINNFREREKENLNSRKLCEKSDNSELTELIEKLKLELEKSKTDSSRYRSEYQILVKQVSISKDTISKLEGQVVDLKQIISKLTRNNGELLEIVSEKISYEDEIKQLQLEKSQVIEKMKFEVVENAELKQKLENAEQEIKNLKSVASEFLNDLPNVEPLNLPSMSLGEDTRHVLGLDDKTVDDNDQKDEDQDSAYDDPRTESIRSRPKSNLSQDRHDQVKTQVFQPLNIELSETDDDATDGKNSSSKLRDKVHEISLRLGEIDIPKPRPFPNGSLHLSLSSLDSENHGILENSTLSEAKFLKGLEDSIELDKTNMTD